MSKTIISKNECKNQHKETSLHYLSLLSVERNFEKFPLWSVVPKWGTTLTSSKTIELEPHTFPDGRVVRRKLEIVPSAKYGYPTVKTQEIWYALLHLWWQLPEEERKTGIIEFSRRELIVRILGKKFGKDQVKALERAIKQLAATLLHFEYLFYDKEKDELLNFREHGLEASEYKYPSTRKRLLEKAIKELTGKPTSSGAVIERYEFLRTADRKDWKLLTYSDGKAAKKDNVIDLEKTKQTRQKPKEKSSPQPQKLSPEIEVDPTGVTRVDP